MAKGLTVLALALILGGCASASNCAGWSPIRPSRADNMTEITQAQILEHNRFGAKQCGWRSGR